MSGQESPAGDSKATAAPVRAVTEAEARRAFRSDRDWTGTLIRISVRNPARGGGIQRRGAWGRNVHCAACRKLIAYNNESGYPARKWAEIDAGRHLIDAHPERMELCRSVP